MQSEPVEKKRLGFLQGGGEMGRLIRSLNWAASPIGEPEIWPQSLRTTLSIILNSRFPMFLFWGPVYTCFYNDAYRPSLGNNGKHPAALGKSGEEVWPEIWSFIHPLITQVLETGEATWHQDQLLPIYRNGQMEDVYWTFSYSPVHDESGNPAGVFVTCFETTETLRSLNKLKDSEHRFRNLVKQATVGVIVLTGPEMIVEIVNDKCCQLFQVPYSELAGKPIFEVVPEADGQFHNIIDEVKATGDASYLYDYPVFLYLNGEKKKLFIDIICQPYMDIDGSVSAVMALIHDVTEQRAATQKIIFAEERARLAIDSAELGVYEVDLITNNMITTSRFNAIFGYGEWHPRPVFASMIHKDDLPQRNKAHEDALTSGHLFYEARLIWQDGTLHWVRITGKVYYNEYSTPFKLLGVAQDITEQKIFAEELAKQVQDKTLDLSISNKELQKINDELQQYVHVSSHDLQEPVRKIRVYADMIRNRDYSLMGEISRKHFDKICEAAERLSASLKDLLDFNSLSSEEQLKEVNLNEIMQGVTLDLELIIIQKQAVIDSVQLPVLQAIPHQMHQLLYNLINNALKFSKPEMPSRIDIRSRYVGAPEMALFNQMDVSEPFYEISIKDNGIGFEQKNAEKIFTIFQRLHNREEYNGTGIGLALCKKVAWNHGGRIWAESKPGEGAVFYILLPVKYKNSRAGQ
ncbi:MAG: ATP-binding protein [Flavitalea sp.]